MSEPVNTQPNEQPVDESAENLLGDAGKKALDAMKAERNAAKRERDALKVQLDQIQQAQMSDLEKATQRAADAEKRAADLERESRRQRVALAKGVPANLVDRLRGDSEDEISADADSLLALLNAPRTPKPDASQGGGGPTPPALNSDALEEALRTKLGIG